MVLLLVAIYNSRHTRVQESTLIAFIFLKPNEQGGGLEVPAPESYRPPSPLTKLINYITNPILFLLRILYKRVNVFVQVLGL